MLASPRDTLWNEPQNQTTAAHTTITRGDALDVGIFCKRARQHIETPLFLWARIDGFHLLGQSSYDALHDHVVQEECAFIWLSSI